jgi:hypothetical protein
MTLLPTHYRWLIGLAAIAAAVLAFNTWRAHLVAEADQAGYARALAEYTAQDLQAVNAARAEEHRRAQALQGVIDATESTLARARADHAAAVAAGQRLRAQLDAARCGTGRGAAASGTSPSTQPAADLYAGVQRRLDEAADGIARHADESRIAGLACERAYSSLTPPP